MSSILHDLRFGCRMFLRNSGFTGVVVVTLALGIGINAIIFRVPPNLGFLDGIGEAFSWGNCTPSTSWSIRSPILNRS